MAWIYLAESEGSVSRSTSGLSPSPIVKERPMLKVSYCPECKRVSFREHLFGTTFAQCRCTTSSAQSTSSTADSPVKTSAVQELESAWAESEADFSSTSQGLSKKQTRDSYFSRTSQQLELVASTVSSKHLPSSGMILDGRLFQPKKLVPVTFEKDGSDLPTPTAQNYGSNQGGAAGRQGKRRLSVESMARRGLIPTPMARDWKGSGGVNRESPDLSFTMGGNLNPRFVEEIMGYPVGHTSLEDWAMQWFRSKRKSRSSASQDSGVNA
jgi:hypothetical protein